MATLAEQEKELRKAPAGMQAGEQVRLNRIVNKMLLRLGLKYHIEYRTLVTPCPFARCRRVCKPW